MRALASRQVKDRPLAGRTAAALRAVLELPRGQGKLAAMRFMAGAVRWTRPQENATMRKPSERQIAIAVAAVAILALLIWKGQYLFLEIVCHISFCDL